MLPVKDRLGLLVLLVFLIGPLLLNQWLPPSAKARELKSSPAQLNFSLSHDPSVPTVFGAQISSRYVSPLLITRALEANLSWIRYDGQEGLFWSDVEAEPGVYDWSTLSQFEQEISSLSKNGLKPMVVIGRAPNWALQTPTPDSDGGCGPLKEEALDDFATFMRQLVTRYSAAPYNVTYWELGNEPDIDLALVGPDNFFGCWGDDTDPYYGGGYYAEMLKQVYPAIKEANPDAQVLIGGLNLDCDPTNPPPNKDCKPAKFLEGILQNGGGDYFDIVSYHGYAYWAPSFAFSGDWDLEHAIWQHRGGIVLGKVDFMREVLAQYGVEKEIFLTESSLLCYESNSSCWCDDPEQACLRDEFFDAQANYVIRLYSRIWANELVGAIWFQLRYNHWRLADLLGPGQTPKPAYHAVQFMSSLLSGATYDGPLSTSSVEGYQFQHAEREQTYQLYWTNDQNTTESLPRPENTLAVLDKFGEEIRPSDSSQIEIGFDPRIIQIGPPPTDCEAMTIYSIGSGSWNNPNNWSLNRVPNGDHVVWIQERHSISAPSQVTIGALCHQGLLESQPNNDLSILASDVITNYQSGQIVGQEGNAGSGSECGTAGRTLQIAPADDDGVQITNRGTIQGGHGGHGETCVGDGGSVYLLARHLVNESSGQIQAGDGGNLLETRRGERRPVTGTTRALRSLWSPLLAHQGTDGALAGARPLADEGETKAGRGGDTTIRGNFNGLGNLSNQGLIASGKGGAGNPNATSPQAGGDGGDLTLIAGPTVTLHDGTAQAGEGGQGSANGLNGRDGQIWIDPEHIILSRATVNGGNITISGGDDGLLELTEMNGHVISASASITLAVGTGGVIDLTGNQEPILEAKQQILIASDQILLDEGTVLTDIVRAPAVMTSTITQPPRYMSLIAPQAIVARPALTQAIELIILNNGALADTYALTVTDSADWSLSALPTPITVEGLGSQALVLTVTPPLNSSGERDTISLTVTSQSDQNVRQEAEIDIFVLYETYLPMISR